MVQACGRILHGKSSNPVVARNTRHEWIIGTAQFNKEEEILRGGRIYN